MSYLVTVNQGPLGLRLVEDGKVANITLSEKERIVVRKKTDQIERLRSLGVLRVRKATLSDRERYKVYDGGKKEGEMNG